jgi:hypothetical protein
LSIMISLRKTVERTKKGKEVEEEEEEELGAK